MKELKYFIKCIVFRVLRGVCYLFCFIPVKKNRCLFMSWSGKQYSCNPRAMHEYFLSQNIKGYDAVWVLDKGISCGEIPSAKIVRSGTLKWFYYKWTSQYIIHNAAGKLGFIPTRRSQKLIKTWHGGGAYKRVSMDIPNEKHGYFERKIYSNFDKKKTVYLSSCDMASRCVIQGGLLHDGEIWNTGTPRNDVFFKEDNSLIREKVTTYYGIKSDEKILLYAPTFRDSQNTDIYNLDCNKLRKTLNERFGGEWNILVRMHQLISKEVNLAGSINANDYPDMQELLVAAYAFITDYSSTVWDFSFTDKPGFLYAVDLADYMVERNFYVDIKEWPYEFSSNMDELVDNILKYNEEEAAIKRKQHHDFMGSYENGTACEQLMKLMELK